jgi:hypothetical protein
MHEFAQATLVAALMSGAVACGGEPTIRQQAGAATPDRPAATAPPAPVSQTPVETADVEALEPLFPTVSGWERGEIQGEKALEPVSVTQVHLEYRRGNSRVDASIVDTGLNQSYLAPFTLFLAQGYKKETPTGYERAVQVGDYPAWERWYGDTKNGELNVLVGRRFLVQLDGLDIENTKVLHELLQKFDLKKLGEVK